MMGLRDVEASLPPGFRFHPSDEELVCHYLFKKVAKEQYIYTHDALINHQQQLKKCTLVEVDLHTCEPWQLPEVARLNTNEWYFFSFRDRKYATGYRTNRATTSGYWKATGKDRIIYDQRTREIVGMRKTLVFYQNRAPNGIKTGYIMHEFRLENPNMPPKEDWVLCRVFHKGQEVDENNTIFRNTIDVATSSLSDQTLLLPGDELVNFPKFMNYDNLFTRDQINHTSISEVINSKSEDDGYAYLFAMDFDKSSLRDDQDHTNLEEMKLEDDGSFIFL